MLVPTKGPVLGHSATIREKGALFAAPRQLRRTALRAIGLLARLVGGAIEQPLLLVAGILRLTDHDLIALLDRRTDVGELVVDLVGDLGEALVHRFIDVVEARAGHAIVLADGRVQAIALVSDGGLDGLLDLARVREQRDEAISSGSDPSCQN